MSIKESILKAEFNPNNAGGEMFVNVNNYGVSDAEVRMLLDYMEDDMFIILSSKSDDVYSVVPTDRGILHFKQIF